MTYHEIKEKHQTAYNKIMEENQLFWAFSDEQFKEGLAKINLPKGEKLTRFIGGGFLPSKNFDKMIEQMKEADKEEKRELKNNKDIKNKAILYELSNHECFYTGEIDNVVELFKDIYTVEDIKKVYQANYANAEL